jgi:hypothetical protein
MQEIKDTSHHSVKLLIKPVDRDDWTVVNTRE